MLHGLHKFSDFEVVDNCCCRPSTPFHILNSGQSHESNGSGSTWAIYSGHVLQTYTSNWNHYRYTVREVVNSNPLATNSSISSCLLLLLPYNLRSNCASHLWMLYISLSCKHSSQMLTIDGFHGVFYHGNWRALHHHAACWLVNIHITWPFALQLP